MKLKQLIGPFKEHNQSINIPNVNYIQIGIEHPHSIPISEINLDNWPIIIGINTLNNSINKQQNFIMHEKDILEFRYNKASINIWVEPISNPYLIINIAYEDTN